jgi:hypothetical protein
MWVFSLDALFVQPLFRVPTYPPSTHLSDHADLGLLCLTISRLSGCRSYGQATITTIGTHTTIERNRSNASIPNTITVPVRRRTWAESDHLTVKKRDVRARMQLLHMQVRQVCSAADSILNKLLLVFCHQSAKDTDMPRIQTIPHSLPDTMQPDYSTSNRRVRENSRVGKGEALPLLTSLRAIGMLVRGSRGGRAGRT